MYAFSLSVAFLDHGFLIASCLYGSWLEGMLRLECLQLALTMVLEIMYLKVACFLIFLLSVLPTQPPVKWSIVINSLILFSGCNRSGVGKGEVIYPFISSPVIDQIKVIV